ncbi:hypothetical protein DPMN_159581 [Dreissena polymorpha]|uniref:Uncharacterized protein n=1 Tax=Dreissena polymorpha TaxID=45954 RepID=A0A9D4EPF2_DREPO|nr:hypothetical protein DPMN_159581 [Dreissena polymorpha]
MDFSKAFDVDPNKRFLVKVGYYGIRGHVLSWIEIKLPHWSKPWQRVLVEGQSSNPADVTAGVFSALSLDHCSVWSAITAY